MSDSRLNKTNPPASPKPLFFVCDFARRTYLEYLIPLFPVDASLKVLELANPYLFQYPDQTSGVFAHGYATDMEWLENGATWPAWNAKRQEAWADSVHGCPPRRSSTHQRGTKMLRLTRRMHLATTLPRRPARQRLSTLRSKRALHRIIKTGAPARVHTGEIRIVRFAEIAEAVEGGAA